MFIIITTPKRLKELCQEHYTLGIKKGYELGWRTQQTEKTNRGFIISSKVAQDIEEILSKEGD